MAFYIFAFNVLIFLAHFYILACLTSGYLTKGSRMLVFVIHLYIIFYSILQIILGNSSSRFLRLYSLAIHWCSSWFSRNYKIRMVNRHYPSYWSTSYVRNHWQLPHSSWRCNDFLIDVCVFFGRTIQIPILRCVGPRHWALHSYMAAIFHLDYLISIWVGAGGNFNYSLNSILLWKWKMFHCSS